VSAEPERTSGKRSPWLAVLRTCGLCLWVAAVLFFLYVAGGYGLYSLADRTCENVARHASNREDVLRMARPWFRESKREPEWRDWLPSGADWTSYRYATLLGIDFYVVYSPQGEILRVIPTYE